MNARHLSSRIIAGLLAAAAVSGSAAHAQLAQKPVVTGAAEGPTESRLAGYTNHEGHPIRVWHVALQNEKFRAGFQCWVDVDPSHAPNVLPLEGMLGFPEPAGGNWYSNGFLNLFIGDQVVGTVPPGSVRVLETGERGRARFVWQRPEGTWCVVFVLLPKEDRVFCAVRLYPKDPATPLKMQLTCYPGGQTSDGNRAVTTATRTVQQVNSVVVDGSKEWWYALCDTVYDYGVRGDGGAGVLFTPECMGQTRLEVTGYPVVLHMTAPLPRHEIRMILWDSFFGKKNAEIVEYLKSNADGLLKELRTMSFEDRRLFSKETAVEERQIDDLLGKRRDPQAERAKATELSTAIAALRDRLRQSPENLSPEEEDKWVDLLDARRKFLWDLKWNELLETAQ